MKRKIQQQHQKEAKCRRRRWCEPCDRLDTQDLRARSRRCHNRVLCLHVTIQVALLASGELALLANVWSQLLVNLLSR